MCQLVFLRRRSSLRPITPPPARVSQTNPGRAALRGIIPADNTNGSEQAVGEPAAAVLPQYRPRCTDDVAVRGGGAAAPGGRTSVERLQKCKGRTDCGDDS